MEIYNTLSRKKEKFEPVRKGEARIYTCGMTVYWFAHIGNLRSYVFADTLKRVLKYNGFNVKHVINITDVGHLTSDADTGEDKLEVASVKEGKAAKEIADFYFNDFKENFLALNLIEPDLWPKASEHIKEQIELIKRLEEKDYTYETNDGVYFNTSKFRDYGKLSRKKPEKLVGGKRVDMGNKKNVTDFALWKFSGKKGVRQQEWESPWGVGFPGWHIECSAMATKYLGENFDIHTGGEDHMHIHHENEIAQSECGYVTHPWVKYWMHGAFLVMGEDKMSKSGGKITKLSDLILAGYSPMHYKYLLFTCHYRKQLAYSTEALDSAKITYEKAKNIIREIGDDGKLNLEYMKEFDLKISSDLDMPGALAVMWRMLRDKSAKGKYRALQRMDEIFGLKLLEKDRGVAPEQIRKLADEREKARVNKDFNKSDELRKMINELGWKIEDVGEGYRLSKV